MLNFKIFFNFYDIVRCMKIRGAQIFFKTQFGLGLAMNLKDVFKNKHIQVSDWKTPSLSKSIYTLFLMILAPL